MRNKVGVGRRFGRVLRVCFWVVEGGLAWWVFGGWIVDAGALVWQGSKGERLEGPGWNGSTSTSTSATVVPALIEYDTENSTVIVVLRLTIKLSATREVIIAASVVSFRFWLRSRSKTRRLSAWNACLRLLSATSRHTLTMAQTLRYLDLARHLAPLQGHERNQP